MRKSFVVSMFMIFMVSTSFASLAVTPSRVDIRIANNDTISSKYFLTNNYSGDIEVKVTKQNWNSYQKNINVDSWFLISTETIKIKKGGTVELPYTIKTSSSMKGSVSAQVSFTVQPPGNEGLNIKTTLPVYLTIYNTEVISFSVSDLNLIMHHDKGAGYSLNFSVKNMGNIHIRPSGTIELFDSSNKSVLKNDIPETVPVYSGTTRGSFSANIPSSKLEKLAPGKYKAVVKVRFPKELKGKDPIKIKEITKKVNLELDKNKQLKIK